MKKQYLFLSLLGILMVQFGFAQEKIISGTVVDDSGLPLPGATIVVENTTRGVSTDFDGNYSISAASLGLISWKAKVMNIRLFRGVSTRSIPN